MRNLGREQYGQLLRQVVQGCQYRPHQADGPANKADLVELAATNHDQYIAGLDEEIRWRACEAAHRALERLDSAEFGRCLECGQEISPKRLRAVPWAEYCLRCQAGREQALPRAA